MASNTKADPLPAPEVEEVVDTWVETLKITVPFDGYILEDDNFLNLVTTWTVDDTAKKEGVLFSRTYTVLKSSLGSGPPTVSISGPVSVNELPLVSKSGRKKAAVGVGQAAPGMQFLQIWEDGHLQKSYNLGALNLHGSVYPSGVYGVAMAWSPSETKLAYLAEKRVSPTKAFYSEGAISSRNKDEMRKLEKENILVGEEYLYRQTWGEALLGQYESAVVVLDLSTDEFRVLPLPEGNFPTDLQWIGDSRICGTIYPIPIWRLGLASCSNRESIIFVVQDDGEDFELITEPNRACRSPRVRPDGNYLVWQERALDGPHERARSVHGIELRDGKPSGQPRLIYSSVPPNGTPVYVDFPRNNCWTTDGSTLFTVTPNEAIVVCLAISVAGLNEAKRIERVDSLMAITAGYMLVSSSSSTSPPILQLLSISEDYRPIPITSSTPIQFPTPMETQFISGEYSPVSIYNGPIAASVPPNSVPLLVCAHGGPHSTFVDFFSHDIPFLLKLGYAILRVNFVGSIGGSRDTADELMGRIGDVDVKDCQATVEKVLSSFPVLNRDKVGVYGGSHGGFLSAHLSGQYPDLYKAAVMLGPMIDVATFVGTTDISDWAYAESGLTPPEGTLQTLIPTARNLDDAEKFIKGSPIHYAKDVQGATLLLLGAADLRVQPQQGVNYYRALLAYGKIAELRMYPANHSLSPAPVRFDYNIQLALWFKRYLDQ